ncbi:MAG: hypothetical protein U0165_20465 [Polyangiaceae bacterium]
MGQSDVSEALRSSLDARRIELVKYEIHCALILQNARFAKRVDIDKKRSAEREQWLQRLGLLFCAVGLIMAIATPALWPAVPLFFLSALMLVFHVPLRRALIRWTDTLLERKAERYIQEIRTYIPCSLTYEMTPREVTLSIARDRSDASQSDTPEKVVHQDISELHYGLVGEHVLCLFEHRKTQQPSWVVILEPSLASASSPSVQSEGTYAKKKLEHLGIDIETIDETLLPESTIQRRFPKKPS